MIKKEVIQLKLESNMDKYSYSPLTDDKYQPSEYIDLNCHLHGKFIYSVRSILYRNAVCKICKSLPLSLKIKCPELYKQIDLDELIVVHPDAITIYTDILIRWRCKNQHITMDSPRNRYCRFERTDNVDLCQICDSLKYKFPGIYVEIHPTKNGNEDFSLISCGSSKECHWQCKKCGHEWRARIQSRVQQKDSVSGGCVKCYAAWRAEPEPGESLADTHKEIADEWDPSNPDTPAQCTRASDKRRKWICKKCGFRWEATIQHRTVSKTGCPRCVKRGWSNEAVKWLEEIMKIEGTYIQHAGNEGEVRIPGLHHNSTVDGYCAATNTVFEYYGDIFHANPNKYKSNDINPILKIKNGDVFRATMAKEEKIRSLGYNLVSVWASEYNQWITAHKKAYEAAPIAMAYITELLNNPNACPS